jgi:CubicO group peptidase (beta-lactamase class C family)
MKCSLLILLLSISLLTYAQPDKYRVIADSLNTNKKFDGVILVGINEKIANLSALGTANRQQGLEIKKDGRFRIASITKTFTATLIMKLVEDGRLELNAVLGRYLKDYKGEAKNKVTIHHLLTYSSGIPDCEGGKGMEVYKTPLSQNEFIDKYCSGNLVSEPGKNFSYSNGDYILLGKIIEEVTGMKYAEYLEKTLLKPLKLRNTGMATSQTKNIVPSYTYDDSLKTTLSDEPYYIENYFAAGAMYSTAGDLYTFDKALFSYKILKKETVDLMITPNKDLQNVCYGFWFSNGFGSFSNDFVYRPGGILGSTANWIHELGSNKTILILSNTNQANLFELSSLFAGIQ